MTPRQLVALLFLFSFGCNVDKVPLRSANDPMLGRHGHRGCGCRRGARLDYTGYRMRVRPTARRWIRRLPQWMPLCRLIPPRPQSWTAAWALTAPWTQAFLIAPLSTHSLSTKGCRRRSATRVPRAVPQPGLMPAAIPDGTCMTCENAPRPTWRLWRFAG